MHGGNSPGAPKGESNGAYVHGLKTNEMKELRALVAEMAAEQRAAARAL